MSGSPEVRLAVQAERMQNILDMLQADREDKKELTLKVGQMFQILTAIENRVKVLEEHAEKDEDIREEYLALKNEISGAKKVMRGLWIAIAGTLAFGMSIKTELINWFNS